MIRRRSLLAGSAASISLLSVKKLFSQTLAESVYKQKRVALILENWDYQNVSKITGAQVDADALESALKGLNFLSLRRESNLDLGQMYKALFKFKADARSADVAFLYYTGHGVEMGGVNYLLPIDIDLQEADAAAYLGVPSDFAVGAVAGAKRVGFLMLDACRDDPFMSSLKIPGDKKVYDHGLAPLSGSATNNILVQYATAVGDVVVEGPSGGVYARTFAKEVKAPGVSLSKIVENTTDGVIKETNQNQRPYVFGSVQDLSTFYLIPPKAAPVETTKDKLVVDIQLTDPDDEEAIKKVLGPDSHNDFSYTLSKVDDGSLSISPDIEYFLEAEGEPLIDGEEVGYFAPEEGIGYFGMSYPVLDIIARRAVDEVITLASIELEVERSVDDLNPYIYITSPSNEFGTLYFTNEGWTNIALGTLDFDILTSSAAEDLDADAFFEKKKSEPYSFHREIGPFKESLDVSFEKELRAILPDFKYYRYAFDHLLETDNNGNRMPISKSAPKGYKEWLDKNPKIAEFKDPENWQWPLLVGKMEVKSVSPSVPPITLEVVAGLAIYSPEGLGGGSIEYNLSRKLILKRNKENYRVSQPIGYLLDKDTKTFRGLFPLVPERTSHHKFRLILKGNGGVDLFTSDWISAKVFVPKTSKKYALHS